MVHVLNFVYFKFVSWGCFQGAETPCGFFLWRLVRQTPLYSYHRLTFSTVLSLSIPPAEQTNWASTRTDTSLWPTRWTPPLPSWPDTKHRPVYIRIYIYWFRTFPQRVPHAPLEKRKTGNAPQPARCERKRKRDGRRRILIKRHELQRFDCLKKKKKW